MTGPGSEPAIIICTDWHARDSGVDTVKINHEIGGRLRRTFRLRLSRLWLFRGRGFGRGLSGDTDFITFRREGMLDVFAQSHRIDICVAVCRIVEFDIRDLGGELAIADVIEITALRIPDGIERIEIGVGHPMHFVVGSTPNVNRCISIRSYGHAESEVVAARRPRVIANLSAG